MAAESATTTLFGKWKNWAENHKLFARILFLGFVLTTITTFSTFFFDTAPKIKAFFKGTSNIASNPDAQQALTKVLNYYRDLQKGSVDVAATFSNRVEIFIKMKNPSHEEIEAAFATWQQEFASPTMKLLDSTFSFSKSPSGEQTVIFWGNFSCFRKSKMKYQTCLVQSEFVFDANGKIKSLKELAVKDLTYSTKVAHLRGK